MDPLADKLMVCTALLGQGLSGVFPWPAILIVMTKEVVMIIGGIYMLQTALSSTRTSWAKRRSFPLSRR